MKAHGTATRRFYNAFYHWTLLIESPHSSARALSTTRYLASRYDSTHRPKPQHPSLPTAYRDRHLERQYGGAQPAEASGQRMQQRDQSAARDSDANPVPSIIHGEVQGPQERPFSSMQPWDEVVRYKSFAGFSVEMCIPGHIIKQIEEQGPLQNLLNLHDLQIDVGETVINRTASGLGVPVRSVLCTGVIEDIEVVRSKFGKLRDKLAALGDVDTGMRQQGEGNNVILQHQNRTATKDTGRVQANSQLTGDDSNRPVFRRIQKLYDDGFEPKQQQNGNGSGTQVWRRTVGTNSKHIDVIRTRSAQEKQRREGDGDGFELRLEKSLQAIETFVAEMRQQRLENQASSGSRKQSLQKENDRPVKKQVNHASSQHPKQRTNERTENESSITSEPTGAFVIAQTAERTDLDSTDSYYLEVEVPKRLTSDLHEQPFLFPTGFLGQLLEIQKRTQIVIAKQDTTPYIRLEGRLASIEQARQAIQSIVHEKCDSMSIPRRKLNEIIPPTQSAEAKVLVQKRRQEAKEDAIKMLLRPMTHPVVLIIAATRNVDTGSKAVDYLRGVTVSSLTSVAMSPKPILSFNLRLPSRTWDAIQKNPTICINLLEASAEGAAIAHAFTKPHEDPAEAFRELRRLGYVVRNFPKANILRLSKPHPSGVVDLESAIFGFLVATVKLDSCVKVGDHVIVVAEVINTLIQNSTRERAATGETFGLAYANRGYRVLGSTIEPMQIPEEAAGQVLNDSASPGVVRDIFDAQIGDETGLHEPDELPIEVPRNDIHEQPFISENATNSNHLTNEQIASPTDGAIPLDAEDLISLPTMQTVESPNVEVMSQALEHIEAADTVDHDASETDNQLPSKLAPVQPSTTDAPATRGPPPDSQPRINSSVSFLKQIWRGYSTSAKPLNANEAHLETSTTLEADQLESSVSDKSLLSTTAREFLNSHDQDPYVPRRMRAMMKAKKEASLASKRLERALANGTITTEESERLENIISRNERWIAKKLAFNSAYDLRLMLDKGKVDVRRAQWLENSIEKGQAVLLDELRQVRGLYDQGKFNEAKYKIVKEDLEKDNLILATEAMRLRQMVDDDMVDDGGAPLDERKGFDGFRGNV